jgi:hypothetical protein
MGQARRGVTGGPLTQARMTVRRRRTNGGEWQRSEFDAGVEESKSELESEGRRCGSDQGSLGFYIWAGGAPERR